MWCWWSSSEGRQGSSSMTSPSLNPLSRLFPSNIHHRPSPPCTPFVSPALASLSGRQPPTSRSPPPAVSPTSRTPTRSGRDKAKRRASKCGQPRAFVLISLADVSFSDRRRRSYRRRLQKGLAKPGPGEARGCARGESERASLVRDALSLICLHRQSGDSMQPTAANEAASKPEGSKQEQSPAANKK